MAPAQGWPPANRKLHPSISKCSIFLHMRQSIEDVHYLPCCAKTHRRYTMSEKHWRNHQIQTPLSFHVVSTLFKEHGKQYHRKTNSGHTKISNHQHEVHCNGGRATLTWEGARNQTSARIQQKLWNHCWRIFCWSLEVLLRADFPLNFAMKIMPHALGVREPDHGNLPCRQLLWRCRGAIVIDIFKHMSCTFTREERSTYCTLPKCAHILFVKR